MSIFDRCRHFDTQGRFWTPEWDYQRNEPKTVEAIQLPDGAWHEFKGFVSVGEANEVYQAAIRARLGLSSSKTKAGIEP